MRWPIPQALRKQKGSAKRKKSQRKLARLPARIAHIRQDALHKATAALVAKNKPSNQRPTVIVLEDRKVSGCRWRHPHVTLADRVFICEECGLPIDRDLNAAQNLAALAYCGRSVRYTGTDAWGQGSSGLKETPGEPALGEPGTEPDDHGLSMNVQVSDDGRCRPTLPGCNCNHER